MRLLGQMLLSKLLNCSSRLGLVLQFCNKWLLAWLLRYHCLVRVNLLEAGGEGHFRGYGDTTSTNFVELAELSQLAPLRPS
jgi:hypothetical protein